MRTTGLGYGPGSSGQERVTPYITSSLSYSGWFRLGEGGAWLWVSRTLLVVELINQALQRSDFLFQKANLSTDRAKSWGYFKGLLCCLKLYLSRHGFFHSCMSLRQLQRFFFFSASMTHRSLPSPQRRTPVQLKVI